MSGAALARAGTPSPRRPEDAIGPVTLDAMTDSELARYYLTQSSDPHVRRRAARLEKLERIRARLNYGCSYTQTARDIRRILEERT